jgi:hypothetical protein
VAPLVNMPFLDPDQNYQATLLRQSINSCGWFCWRKEDNGGHIVLSTILEPLMEIKVNFLDKLRLEAKFDDFTVIADQPIRYKGDGSAPGPFDYFLARRPCARRIS